MAHRFGNRSNAAHKSATNAQNMNMHNLPFHSVSTTAAPITGRKDAAL
jgi:hypothetical protein